MFIRFSLMLILLLVSTHAFSASKMITVADIHFDPFYDCEKMQSTCAFVKQLTQEDAKQWRLLFSEKSTKNFSTYGQDTNYALLHSTFNAIKQVQKKENASVVLILGDFLGHAFRKRYVRYSGDKSQAGYEIFVNKTMQFLAHEVKQALPNIDVYIAIGNNDSATGNYRVVPKGHFLHDASQVFKNLINDKTNHAAFIQDFPRAGYYTVSIPNTHHRIIVLNTVLFSSHAFGKTIKKAAEQELTWLDQQLILSEKNHESVLLAFHIPMGIDVYNTMMNSFKLIQTFWKDHYTKQFQKILADHANVIVGILPAHIHKDGFQLQKLNQAADLLISFTPSISPVYVNNPGFKVYDYDPVTFVLNDFSVYYLDLSSDHPEWQKEYDFNQVFSSQLTHPNLLKATQQLLSTRQLPLFLQRYFTVHLTKSIFIPRSVLNYYQCGIQAFTYDDYTLCLSGR